jgi:hypothetical protein
MRAVKMAKRRFKRAKQRFLDPEVLDATSRMAIALLARAGIEGAVGGGYAMQVYGSPRLTGDVDLIVGELPSDPRPLQEEKRLTFGGCQYRTPEGVEVDMIERKDHLKGLYGEALQNAVMTEDGLPILSPEYLAVAKFAAGRPKDEDDLVWLLQQPDLVDRVKALDIAERLVGGKFARDSLKSFIDEADWRAERERKG